MKKRMIKNKSIYLSIFILPVIITVFLWFLSKPEASIISRNPLQSMGQISALIGFTLLSLTIFLTTKFVFLDKFFHGLDKIFHIHKIAGSIAFILLINHPLFFVASDLPNTALAKLYLLPGADVSYTLGVISLYLFFASFIFIVFIKLPYHISRASHQILGLAFLIGGVHSLLISSDVSRFFPLQVWILLLFILGIVSCVYSIFFYSRFGPRYHYAVERIERGIDLINIYLKPQGKKLSFSPGQFIYISFRSKDIGRERHPFSISSAPDEHILRLSVKIAGDYTLNLIKLKEKTPAMLYGPYGQFGRHLFNNADDIQFWIGGGIGITPFLSFIRTQKFTLLNRYVHFFYLFRNPEEGVFTQEIEGMAQSFPNMRFYDWCTKNKGRINTEILASLIGNSVSVSIFLCGPAPMMESFKALFISLGVRPEKIFMEKFALN